MSRHYRRWPYWRWPLTWLLATCSSAEAFEGKTRRQTVQRHPWLEESLVTRHEITCRAGWLVLVCRCAVCRCAGVQVCRCAGVQVCRCAGVQEHSGPPSSRKMQSCNPRLQAVCLPAGSF